MITGSHPFVRPNTAAMTFAILNQPPAALDAVPTAVRPLVYKRPFEETGAPARQRRRAIERSGICARARSPPLLRRPKNPRSRRAVTPRELKKFIENASTPRWGAAQARWPVRLVLAMLMLALIARSRRLSSRPFASGSQDWSTPAPKNTSRSCRSKMSATIRNIEPVAHGLMDALTNEFSNLEAAQKSLWVVPASEVRNHKSPTRHRLYRDLGATMVVQGSVQRKGPAVYLTVVLIDAKRLRQIGSVELQDPSGDLAIVQNEAVVHLARMMRVKVSDDARAPAAGAPRQTPTSLTSKHSAICSATTSPATSIWRFPLWTPP